MNVQPILANQILFGKKPKTNKNKTTQDYSTVPLKQDTFETSKKEFSLDDSMKTLSNLFEISLIRVKRFSQDFAPLSPFSDVP